MSADNYPGIGRVTTRHKSILVALLMLILTVPVSQAFAQQAPPPLPALPPLPGGATPGGALPQEDFLPPPTLRPEDLIFEVPPVFQRPLGVDEGIRIFVKGFKVEGVVDEPEAGISIEEIDERVQRRFNDLEDLVEGLRVDRQDQQEVGPDGFTPEERKRIVEFMREVVKDFSPDRQVDEYRAFVDQLRLQKLDRDKGLTIGQLQLVADEVTNYYRERGYFLARGLVPAQEVVDGIVVIRVLEGRLGRVLPVGNKRYSSEQLASPFKTLQGQLVTVNAVEDALLTLSVLPGLNASGVFRPGQEIGQADITINVQSERRTDWAVYADNHGTEFTGRNRFIGDLKLNNLSGAGDWLNLVAIQTFNPQNGLYGEVSYAHPIGSPRNWVGINASRNVFDVTNLTGGGGSEISGESEIGTLWLTLQNMRTRQVNLNTKVELSRKRADTESLGLLISRDDLAVLSGEFNFEQIHSSVNAISSGFIRIDHGLNGGLGTRSSFELSDTGIQPPPSRRSGDKFADSNFNKISFGYAVLKLLGEGRQTFSVRVNGQYTTDVLSSLEMFVIGGPNNVRAIPASHFLTDNGIFTSVEWRISAPGFADKPVFGNRTWGDVFRFKVFSDYALGWLNRGSDVESTPETSRVSVGGHGVGIEFGIPGQFSLNLQWAKLTGGERPGTSETDVRAIRDDKQFWIDISAEF